MQRKTENEMQEKKRITRARSIQSVIAGIYILLAFWIMNLLHSDLAVTSLAASAFVVFSFPHDEKSRPRILIGGYSMGIMSGLFCYALSAMWRDFPLFPGYIPACAIAVILSIFFMTLLHFEHPPAVAMAAALVIDYQPVIMALATLGCVLILCTLKGVLKKYLHNLA